MIKQPKPTDNRMPWLTKSFYDVRRDNAFREITGFPNYFINIDGVVVNAVTKKTLPVYDDLRDNVPRIGMFNDKGNWVTTSLITLMGKMFMILPGCPQEDIRQFVPKDGDYSNIDFRNIVPIYKYYKAPVNPKPNVWYPIPEFSRFKIKLDGTVKDQSGSVIHEGDMVIFVRGDNGASVLLRSFEYATYLWGITFLDHSGYWPDYMVTRTAQVGPTKPIIGITPTSCSKADLIKSNCFNNVVAVDPKDGDPMLYFNSETVAAKYFKISRRTILRRIIDGKPVFGYYKFCGSDRPFKLKLYKGE